MSHTRIYHQWVRRIDSGVLTQSLCRQFASAVARQAAGREPQGFRTNLRTDEAVELVTRIKARGGVRLTPNDEARGLAWLRNYGSAGLPIPADVIDHFDHFTYNGEQVTCGNNERSSVPVWHVHTDDGREFTYTWTSWQTNTWGQGSRSWKEVAA